MKLKYLFITSLLFALFLAACNSGPKSSSKSAKDSEQEELGFRDVDGIRFYEVKRRFKNGLSFNKIGFQQEPTWIIQFKAPDTMLAYSPEKQGMEAFYLQFDHGKVYNFAREFFRAIVITKDSLVLQRLQVDGRVIAGDDDERSDVFCTYYTRDYIEKKLHTTVGELQRPTKADTLFIKSLAEKSDKDPANPEIAFAARQPVSFKPKGPYVTVEKISNVDVLQGRTLAYDYLYPEFRLVIQRSYKAFAYRFSVVVDAHGKMTVNRVEGVMQQDLEPRKRLIQGILDVYVRNLYQITPGSTLGIPHSSEITLNLVGKLAK